MLPGCGPGHGSRLQLDVALLRTGGTTTSEVGIPKHVTSLDWKDTRAPHTQEMIIVFIFKLIGVEPDHK